MLDSEQIIARVLSDVFVEFGKGEIRPIMDALCDNYSWFGSSMEHEREAIWWSTYLLAVV